MANEGVQVDQHTAPDSERVGNTGVAYDSDFEYLGELASEALGSETNETRKNGESSEPNEDHPPESDSSEETSETIEDTEEESEGEGEEVSSNEIGETDEAKQIARIKVIESENKKLKSIVSEAEQLKRRVAEYEKQVNDMKDMGVAIEQLKSEPLRFIAQYVPGLMKQVEPSSIVQAQLKKEFGDTFKFNRDEADEPGTPSYQFIRREQELRSELQLQKAKAEVEETYRKREHEARLERSKQETMKKWKLTEDQFNREILDFSKSIQFDYDTVAKLRFFDDLVKRAISKANKTKKSHTPSGEKFPKSPATTRTGDMGKKIPKHLQDLQNAFGDL